MCLVGRPPTWARYLTRRGKPMHSLKSLVGRCGPSRTKWHVADCRGPRTWDPAALVFSAAAARVGT